MTPRVMMHPHPAHRETWLPDANNVLGFLRNQFLDNPHLFALPSTLVNSIVIICIISLHSCVHNRRSPI